MKKRTNRAKGILLLAFVLFAIVVGGLVFRKYRTATTVVHPPEQAEQARGMTLVTLFFATPSADGLAREGRELETEATPEEMMESVVDELVSGPLGSLAPTLPPNTRVLGVHLKEGVAQVDFGRELVDALPSGSSAEMAAVYSVVDTLAANFPQVKGVQFLVEGAPVSELKGHLDLGKPLPPDFTLEKKEEMPQETPVEPGAGKKKSSEAK